MLKKITCILLFAFVFLTACVTKNNKNQTKEKSIPTIAETHQTNNISMVDFTGVPHIKSWVSQFNGNHSEIDIEFVSKTDDEEDFWNAIMAELALGKGPDLFCMWAGDERILALNYKGVLANLDDYVPLEIKKNIFSGIIQSGTIDQKWIGLGVEGMPQILIVSDALWGKDRWSLEDIVSISKEHTDMEGLFVNLDFTYNGEGDPLKNAEYLFDNPDIFVDINQKNPKFENQSFIDALELIKGYAPISIRKNEIVDYLKEGKILGAFTRFYDTQSYVNAMSEYCSNGCHFTGMVGQEDYVGRWSSVYLIMVNKNTEHFDAIREFMEGLLDYDKQNNSDMALSVREDVVRGKVLWADWSNQWEYRMGEKTYISFSSPEGESYLEEYVSFLNKLGPCTEKEGTIKEILLEEVEDYLQNTYSATETAKIINNRIRLYLLEN